MNYSNQIQVLVCFIHVELQYQFNLSIYHRVLIISVLPFGFLHFDIDFVIFKDEDSTLLIEFFALNHLFNVMILESITKSFISQLLEFWFVIPIL